MTGVWRRSNIHLIDFSCLMNPEEWWCWHPLLQSRCKWQTTTSHACWPQHGALSTNKWKAFCVLACSRVVSLACLKKVSVCLPMVFGMTPEKKRCFLQKTMCVCKMSNCCFTVLSLTKDLPLLMWMMPCLLERIFCHWLPHQCWWWHALNGDLGVFQFHQFVVSDDLRRPVCQRENCNS